MLLKDNMSRLSKKLELTVSLGPVINYFPIPFNSEMEKKNCKEIISGFVRVLENLESPGIFLWHFPGLESPGKRPLVLESPGNLLNSTKLYEVYGRQ